jgi:hypothetical protein
VAEARQYLLERVDDAAIVQVYADGFTPLPLREKLPRFAMRLWRA